MIRLRPDFSARPVPARDPQPTQGAAIAVAFFRQSHLALRAMYALCMQTSMRVTPENRDSLARIAATELGGATLDEALQVVLFEHHSRAALARLATDPDATGSYLAEATQLAEVDTAVKE